MANVKRQMSGLKGSIKVNAIVNDMRKVTSAVSKGSEKIHNAQVVAYQKAQARIKQSQKKGALGSSSGDVSHLFGFQGAKYSAANSAFADMLRKEERQAIQSKERLYAADFKAAETARAKELTAQRDMQKRERHIQNRVSGMGHTFGLRLGGTGTRAYEQAITQSTAAVQHATAAYRRGAMTQQEFNAAITRATQAQVRQGLVNRQNAMSFRSLRTDLVQATAAYTAFSAAANVFNTGKELQSLRAGMLISAGNEAGVRREMDWLVSQSERLGTNFMAAAQEYTKFSIVAKNKMAAGEARELFEAFSELATVQQMDTTRFHRGMNSLMQINGLPLQ